MIRYTLRCAEGHEFESWFQSAEAFDKVKAAGGLTCALCGDARVEKSLMAPSVAPSRRKAEAPADPAPAPSEKPATPMLSAPDSPLEAALKTLREKVESSAENVGRDFSRLAREMHDGEIEGRPIYGEATHDEARELIEDGVPVAPLPWRSRRDS